MRRLLSIVSAAALLAVIAPTAGPTRLHAQADATQVVPPAAYQGLRWRSVGAGRGGRVTGFSGVRQQPHTFYIGATGGGVWKTDDAGINWYPIGDGQLTTGSIGSIEVAPSSPNHVWVGTGSAPIRSNVIIGRGVYKSDRRGQVRGSSWASRRSGQIGGIKRAPVPITNIGVAGGHSARRSGPTTERGIFKTTDGGQDLEEDAVRRTTTTGGRDIEVDWENPEHPLRRRCTRASARAGTSSAAARPSEGGIYKSTDGGETWKHLTAGLPART